MRVNDFYIIDYDIKSSGSRVPQAIFRNARLVNSLNEKGICNEELIFEITEDSCFVDLIDCLNTTSLIVSEGFKECLEKFDLGDSKWIECRVVKGVEFRTYYFLWMTIFHSNNQFLDFGKSFFSYNRINLFEQDKDFQYLNEEAYNEDKDKMVYAKKITLNEEWPEYDLFRLNDFSFKVCSEQLAKEIISKEFTGIEVIKTNKIKSPK